MMRALCWAHFLLEEITLNHSTNKTFDFDGWMRRTYGKKFYDSLDIGTFEEAVEEARTGEWTQQIRNRLKFVLGCAIDPKLYWDAVWDGKWRMVVFDLPQKAYNDRKTLARILRFWRFGHSQGSFWISPHPLTNVLESLSRENISSRGLVISEGELLSPKSPQDIVDQTWDWDLINAGYEDMIRKIVLIKQEVTATETPSQEQLMKLVQESFQLWSESSESDPFLPKTLRPRGYQGIAAYKHYCDFRKMLKTVSKTGHDLKAI